MRGLVSSINIIAAIICALAAVISLWAGAYGWALVDTLLALLNLFFLYVQEERP